MDLPPPARYFPAKSGRYDTAPALRPLGTDFGNGAADGQVIQLDDRFPEYRANKLRCLQGAAGRASGRQDLAPEVERAVAQLLIARLLVEHPALFRFESWGDGRSALHCRLTGEVLRFDYPQRLCPPDPADPPRIPYHDALDALGAQIQEDFAVVRSLPGGPDRVVAYHVCAPSHWTPAEKLGQSFAEVHAAVPGMEPVNRVGARMAEAMVRQGPFVRFVWGIDTDPRLDRHSEPPCGISQAEWRSPPFDPGREPPFYFRVERQVTWGFPEVDAAIFLIRPYLIDGREVCADAQRRSQLRAALESMSPESRRYKGVAEFAEALIERLT